MAGLPDQQKGLPVLRDEWSECTACDLGVRRETVEGNFIFGEGVPRGIMFVGGGPWADEEKEGRPFVGEAGSILRRSINKLQLDRWYLSNLVTCRACAQAYDTEGNPRYRKDWKTGISGPVIQDCAPTPAQIAACLPRLYEEIYLVDPVVIVAFGAEAAKALYRGAISILAENATTKTIAIPGAGFSPALTEKRKLWYRKVRGDFVMPVEQNQVRYLMVPVVHPAYLLRRSKDDRYGNPIQQFAEGMRVAATIYDRYMIEAYGERPAARALSVDDIKDAIEEDR